MSTMTIPADRTPRLERAATSAQAKPRLSVRLWSALLEVGRKRAEREIASYIRSRGGRATDSLERDIERYCALRGFR